ncbi:MAG: anaerobic ribonucleoside-triphosphate reductase activating protein [Christensenella sp.]|nr:anaerobic ribonucleoside-triphosphate reductase activating protein [Christensenella sp.]
MKIAGLLKTATIDFPGRLSAVVFTPGCNYDCPFCHNRDLLSTQKLLDGEEVKAFLKKRAGLLDGVVVSGGEPTLQGVALIEFLGFLKELSYDVKLDTNGSNPVIVKELLRRGLVDYVAMDYKAPFVRYMEICGGNADAAAVRETLEVLLETGVEFELRTTVIPELPREDIAVMAREIPVLPAYALQLYRPVRVEKLRVYTPRDIEEIAEEIKQFQPNVFSRT